MKISEFHIENTTIFEKIHLKLSPGINVIIGENGVGKTHVLKLVYFSYLKSVGAPVDRTTFFSCADADELSHNQKGDYGGKSWYSSENNEKADVDQFIYIPVEEMLSHSKGLIPMSKKYSKEMPFDKLSLDIIEKAQRWKLDKIPELALNIIPKIEKVINGSVLFENDTFYVLKENGLKIRFSLEAEGLRKFALLWQLIMNESIRKNSILLWDEPDANLNPKLLPILADILIELQRNGVQIVIATHDYILAKYLEVRTNQKNAISFHALYYAGDGNIHVETSHSFVQLKHNPIIESFNALLDEVYQAGTGAT